VSKSHRAVHDGNKIIYATLAEAVGAKQAIARMRGKRWRHQLRIYRTPAGWCLTKMTKGQLA